MMLIMMIIFFDVGHLIVLNHHFQVLNFLFGFFYIF